MKNFFKELGEFASQRSIADVALGLVIGAALSDLVSVIVEEVLLPPISFLTTGMNLENRAIVLREAGSIDGTIPIEDVAIGYGKLIEVSLEFIVIGLALFLVVKFGRALWNRTHPLQTSGTKETALLEQTVALLEEQNQLLEQKEEEKC